MGDQVSSPSRLETLRQNHRRLLHNNQQKKSNHPLSNAKKGPPRNPNSMTRYLRDREMGQSPPRGSIGGVFNRVSYRPFESVNALRNYDCESLFAEYDALLEKGLQYNTLTQDHKVPDFPTEWGKTVSLCDLHKVKGITHIYTYFITLCKVEYMRKCFSYFDKRAKVSESKESMEWVEHKLRKLSDRITHKMLAGFLFAVQCEPDYRDMKDHCKLLIEVCQVLYATHDLKAASNAAERAALLYKPNKNKRPVSFNLADTEKRNKERYGMSDMQAREDAVVTTKVANFLSRSGVACWELMDKIEQLRVVMNRIFLLPGSGEHATHERTGV